MTNDFDSALTERTVATLLTRCPRLNGERELETVVSLTLAALHESGRLVEWRKIDDDTPLSKDLLLAIKEPVGWTIECGWAGGKNTCAPASGYSNGWRHGRASHWAPLPAPPATAATEGK